MTVHLAGATTSLLQLQLHQQQQQHQQHQQQAPLAIMADPNNPCIVDGKCTSPTNFPEFIDTSACLCGLLPSKQEDPNGGYIELWRCIGNASANLHDGSNGKWYNTSLPSQELVGINMPQNWGENGPDTSQAYVIVDAAHGKLAYEKLNESNKSPSLIGADADCNAKNDTRLSTQFYSHTGGGGGKKASNGVTSSLASSSPASPSSASSSSATAAVAASSSATASGTAPASPTGTSPTSSSSSTATHSASGSSDASHTSVTALFLFCMLLAPLFASVA